ncbi:MULTISPECIES: hydroxyisourate hydrolase [Pantoea]|jgi:5-hydroxyisourate hydrolase|uniref:5-hydroxyisourate hydrolase n=1 Tax=Pantoea brenneri TaxID=472694 RepID=A0A653WH54_9GAMM|nr:MULTISPECIES: hydroxyisourate hydrolase [Pantoea]KKD34269.1 5-hydroxyisourate hydrolase [Pantoea sp. 3.5.1]MBS6034930.1 hydroxyisourate hydrolase [Pantoea sp.]MBZ6394054.1 hydroxyisourate hydrolase [Pantoea sp.]MBZ6436568.1 hydroxyisourate hydrolase [Pantoea sp.]MCQ5472563.1 hydroxyisourate hydrolase [Pantoea brenneri]
MSTVTTHILDTAIGKPASGVAISLEQNSPEGWFPLSQGETDSDGRLKTLTPEPLTPGHYRLTAEIGDYFAAAGRDALYVSAQIDFVIAEAGSHFHLPFLISPWSWSTYRGS